jgi:hypothetical protein
MATPTLRLATQDGRRRAGPARTIRPLTEVEGETELFQALGSLLGRLDPAADLRVELSTLLARLERRQARRGHAYDRLR